jgi:chitodextrinase
MSTRSALLRRYPAEVRIPSSAIRWLAIVGALLASLLASAKPAVASAAYVQGVSTTLTTATSSITATFNSAQTSGDLNVVVVDVAQGISISSVTDHSGNTYHLAYGPTNDGGGTGSQSIYYAANIAAASAGVNTVTVTFSGSSADGGGLRAAEYSGLATVSPLDVAGGSVCSGTTNLCSSGSVTTTNAADLLVGVNEANATGPGSGYTERLDSASYNLIIEDEAVTTAGSYSASVYVSPDGPYVTQIVAFKVASGGDTTPPTAPTGLTATAASSSQIGLSWTASTDNVGVTGYRVERCQGSGCTSFAQIGTSSSTSYTDTGLTAATTYLYRVRATDAAGNLSSYSTSASATTSSGGDTQPPTAPSSAVATANSSSQVTVTWTASTDNVGVTAYSVERCAGSGCSNFAQIGTVANSPYADTSVSASTVYLYRVRASDAAGNESAYSNVAQVTTPGVPDTQPPTAPSALTATSVEANGISLTWTASTDNVGVTAYLVERCQGVNCSSFSQIGSTSTTAYADGSVGPLTSYSYRVRATDAANNLSGYSAILSVNTPTGNQCTP